MMDAFDAWEGKGVSYWRVPHELIECWTLEERPLLGGLHHMAPVRKRRLTTPQEEEEEGVSSKAGPKPVRFLGPSTSTQIKVKNSAAVRLSPAGAIRTPPRSATHWSPRGASPRSPGPGHSQASLEGENAENGALPPPPAKVLLSAKKATPHRVIKLKRTPLRAALPSLPTHATGRPASCPEPPALEASCALGVQTENGKDQANG